MKKIKYILLFAIGIVFLSWFLLPYSYAHIKNIGNLTGVVLSLILIVESIFHGKIHYILRKIWSRKIGKALLVIISIAIIIIGAFAAVITGCIIKASANKASDNTTVIVLGCRVYRTSPSLMLTERLDAAYEYLCEHPKTVCILSGGKGNGEDISEALCMYNYLTKKGVDESRLYLEDKSTSTRENLLYSREIIVSEGLSENVAIVTNEFHQYRASKIAGKLDINVKSINARTAWWLFPTFFIREMWGIMYEWFL